jgi:N-acetyl-D-muramate 6-phosphate phosphatase
VKSDIKAVLFDLDGTLIDSAGDLGLAADVMRTHRGLPSLPLALYRPLAGAGARGMLKIAFGIEPDHPDFLDLREEFFGNYSAAMLNTTYAFRGVPELLQTLEHFNLPWGIVTNKSKRFTEPLVAQMPLLKGAAVVISGDTTPFSKPHPEPLFEAARRLKLAPKSCIYIGDDMRDVQAALAADMPALAATWGYMGEHDVSTWGANALLENPMQVIEWLKAA